MYSILYVDDEPGLLEIAKIFLEQDKEFSVDIDTSAEHALGPIGTRSYDAIVSDYQMPGMDGIAFLKAVRQQYGDIPFILFTGRGREEVVIQAINNGADFYLQKGGDPRSQFAELAHKVRQAVARKRAEYSLVESEKRLTDIINFLPDATFAIDRAGTVIAWNRAIEEMTGVPAREMLGKGDYEYAVPFYGTRRKILIDLIFEPDEVVAKNYANIHREKDVLIADTNLPRPLGKVVRLAGKASPLYDRQGRIVGAIESIRDVTQHERDAEQIAQKTSALSIINRIIQVSNLPQTIDEYTQSVLSLTIDLLHYNAGGVYLIDDDRKVARIVCSENLPPEFITAVDNIDIHAAPYDTLFIRGEPVIIENLGTVLPQAAAVSGFHAIASIPIVALDTVIGALNVASRESSLVAREDREILVAIGKEFGSAITRMKAELALRENEKKYRTLIETTGTGFVIIDGQGTVLDANREYARMTGHASPIEIIGRSVIEWTADHDRERNAGAVRQCMQDGYLRNFEVDYRSPAGKITPVEVNATVLSSNGSVQILTLCRDITDRRRSRDLLRESEEKYRTLIDFAPLAVLVQREGKVVFANPECVRLAGAESEKDLVGRDILPFIHPDDHPLALEHFRALAEGKTVHLTEERLLRMDGTVFSVEIAAKPVLYEGLPSVIVFFRDITDRKQRETELRTAYEKITASDEELRSAYEQLAASEEELRGQYEELAFSENRLRESEGRFRQLADATLEGIVIHQAGRIVDLNDSACSLFGYSRTEMIGKDLHTLAAPDSVDDIHRKIAERYDEAYEAKGLRKDGSVFWAELRSRDFSRGGEMFRITTLWDITARKDAEDAVRESRERLRTFMDSATDAFTIWDTNLNLIDLNNVALSYLPPGTRKEDVIGKKYEELMPGAQSREDYERYLGVIRTGIPYAGREELPGTRYGKHWLAIKAFRVGEGLGIVTSDVTREKVAEEELRAAYEQITASEEELRSNLEEVVQAQKERERSQQELRAAYEQVTAADEELRSQYEELAFAEQKLRESEQQLSEITATVPGVVYQFYARADSGMGVYFVSSRANDVFGIENDPGSFFDKFTGNVDPRDEDRFLDSIRTSIVNGAPWDFEGRYRKPDGERIWFQGIGRPVRKGSEVVYNGILLDITARKKAEEERRISEEKYRHVIEHSPYGMHFYELVPGRGLVFTGANPAADRILKVAHDRFIGKTIEEAFPGLIGTDVPDAYRKVAESGSLWQTEQVVYNEGDVSGAYTVTAFRIAPGSVVASFVDITERKRAENELLLLKISVDRAYDEVFWMDYTGKILYVNDAACQVTGYSREELLAMKIFQLDPDFPPEVWDRSIADLRERKKQFITTRHRCKDGRIIDVEIAATYVFKNGREYSFAFVRDITERKRMEDALFSSQQMLAAVLDAIPQRVFWKDRNSVFLGCNRQNALDAGFSDPSGMVGKTDFDYTTAEIAERYQADDRQVMETGEGRINFEEPQVRQDGSRAWLRTSKIPLRNRAGEIIGVLGTYEDITDEKMAQEQLRESEERYRSLVESSFDGIAIHQDGILVFVNSTAARLLGYDNPSSLTGRPALDLVHPEERARVAARMAESPEKPLELAHERLQRADGGYIQADVAATPCVWKGRPAVYVTFRDISELKRAEEALEKRLVALTRPLEDRNIAFEIDDLFDTGELQRLQDEFAKATGVAVLLTRPDGTPITRPSNFCRLCSEIVRSTEKGRERCFRSDSALGGFHGGAGPYIHTCLSAGLWGAGANIVVGDRHIANWLIGQVRNETQNTDDMRNYAREIGVDEEEFIRAFLEVPVMSTGQFADVAQALSTLANLLSRLAFQNVQQARFITERERAEEALWQKTEELDQYFNASLDLFCIADTGGYFRRLNSEWTRTLGYTVAELEGKQFLDFVHPDDLPGTLAAVADLTDQKSVINFTNRYRHKDGSYRWIEWRSFPKGDLIYAAARDITERKRIEEKLQESEERYRSLFENSNAVMLLIDPETGSIVEANPAACAYYGWNHDELVSRKIDEINTLTPDQVKAEMMAARSQKRSQFHFRHRRADKTIRDVEVYSGPLRIKGRDLLYSIVIDVTERKLMEEELKASEERLRLFIRHAPAALAMLDTEMRYLAVSRRWMADYHLGDQDLTGHSHYEIFPELTEEIKDVLRRGLVGETTSANEDKFERQDGSVQWLAWEVRPWHTAGNDIGGVIIFSEDITRRKQAEEALRESEEKYRTLVERASEAITILQDGRHVYANSRMAEFLGKQVSDIIGIDFLETVWPDDREMLRSRYQDRHAGKPVPETYDFRLIGPDGRPRWVYVSFAKILWKGRPATLNLITDITERKLAEAALRESGEKYRSILENMQDAYFQTGEDGAIMMVNPSAVRMYGYAAAEEMIGLPAHALYARPEAREDMLRNLRDAASGGVTDFNAEGLRKDGTTFGVSLNVQFNRDKEGRIRGTEAIVRNISERRAIEHALQEANRKLALLGSITRHDVANKVAIITGFAQAARMHKLSPEIAAYLTKIEAAGADISRQIAFTKTYQELGVNAPAWCSIPDLVGRQRAEGVAITCTCRAEVYADPMLEKVFFNLVDNAVRHGEKVTEIAVLCTTGPEGLVITVADNGAGVPDELKEKIFDRGFGKHTGFGLFLAREILAITGITIRETGTPGQGARFEMVVPKGLYRGI